MRILRIILYVFAVLIFLPLLKAELRHNLMFLALPFSLAVFIDAELQYKKSEPLNWQFPSNMWPLFLGLIVLVLSPVALIYLFFRIGGMQMEKKRSKGVTFWGWVFIIFGTVGVLGVFNSQQTVKVYGNSFFILNIALSVANLVTGIFILKLNETARKAAILLGVIGFMMIPSFLGPVFKVSFGDATYEKQKKDVIEKIRPEYQQQALVDLKKTHEVVRKSFPVIFIILLGVPIAILELLPIIFFTRSKVKEQFK